MLLSAILRMNEPKIRHVLFNTESKYSEEPLCSFLNSAINIEYVYMILTGIDIIIDTSGDKKIMINDVIMNNR